MASVGFEIITEKLSEGANLNVGFTTKGPVKGEKIVIYRYARSNIADNYDVTVSQTDTIQQIAYLASNIYLVYDGKEVFAISTPKIKCENTFLALASFWPHFIENDILKCLELDYDAYVSPRLYTVQEQIEGFQKITKQFYKTKTWDGRNYYIVII